MVVLTHDYKDTKPKRKTKLKEPRRKTREVPYIDKRSSEAKTDRNLSVRKSGRQEGLIPCLPLSAGQGIVRERSDRI